METSNNSKMSKPNGESNYMMTIEMKKDIKMSNLHRFKLPCLRLCFNNHENIPNTKLLPIEILDISENVDLKYNKNTVGLIEHESNEHVINENEFKKELFLFQMKLFVFYLLLDNQLK